MYQRDAKFQQLAVVSVQCDACSLARSCDVSRLCPCRTHVAARLMTGCDKGIRGFIFPVSSEAALSTQGNQTFTESAHQEVKVKKKNVLFRARPYKASNHPLAQPRPRLNRNSGLRSCELDSNETNTRTCNNPSLYTCGSTQIRFVPSLHNNGLLVHQP